MEGCISCFSVTSIRGNSTLRPGTFLWISCRLCLSSYVVPSTTPDTHEDLEAQNIWGNNRKNEFSLLLEALEHGSFNIKVVVQLLRSCRCSKQIMSVKERKMAKIVDKHLSSMLANRAVHWLLTPRSKY